MPTISRHHRGAPDCRQLPPKSRRRTLDGGNLPRQCAYFPSVARYPPGTQSEG